MAAFFGSDACQPSNNGQGRHDQLVTGPTLKIISHLPKTVRFVYQDDKSDRGRGWIHCQDSSTTARRRTASTSNADSGIRVQVCSNGDLPQTIPVHCMLISELPDKPHAHQLVKSTEVYNYVEAAALDSNNWIATFPRLAISVTKKEPKKKVLEVIKNKLAEQLCSRDLDALANEVLATMNHHIVIMKFEAFVNGQRIEAFSDPILNSRKEMQIARIFEPSGSCTGGQAVHLWVKGKVLKNQVKVVFSVDDGTDDWRPVVYPHLDHQGAVLVFKTPAYRDLCISEEVQVSFWLQNERDGNLVSNTCAFVYTPNPSGNAQKRSRTEFEAAQFSHTWSDGESGNESSSQSTWSGQRDHLVSGVAPPPAHFSPSVWTTGSSATPPDGTDGSHPGSVEGSDAIPGEDSELRAELEKLLNNFSSLRENDCVWVTAESEVPWTGEPVTYQNAAYGEFQINHNFQQLRHESAFQPASGAATGATIGYNPQPHTSAVLVGTMSSSTTAEYDGLDSLLVLGNSRFPQAETPDITIDSISVAATTDGRIPHTVHLPDFNDLLGELGAVNLCRADGLSSGTVSEKKSSRPDSAFLHRRVRKLPASAAARDPMGQTLLHVAVAKRASAKLLELLLVRVKRDINQKTYQGKTALHLAVETDYFQAVEILLKHGARPDVQEHQQGNTPAHLAAQLRNQTIFSYFQTKACESGGYGMDVQRYDSLTPLEVWEMGNGDSSGATSDLDDEVKISSEDGEAFTDGFKNLEIQTAHDNVEEEQ